VFTYSSRGFRNSGCFWVDFHPPQTRSFALANKPHARGYPKALPGQETIGGQSPKKAQASRYFEQRLIDIGCKPQIRTSDSHSATRIHSHVEEQGVKQDGAQPSASKTIFRSFGLGIITGAANDDCSAVGTYSQAGAAFGYSLLWTAPFIFPMMVTVVYLSSKLGQVTGQGLFSVIRTNYSKPLLYFILFAVIVGNTIEAGADIGGIAAALQLLVPLPHHALAACVAAISLALQIWGSYRFISNTFRLLSSALLAYVISMFLAHPDARQITRSFIHPGAALNHNSLAILVAMIGTSLSAYLFTWQSNQEVEEKIAAGKLQLRQRRGTTGDRLQQTLLDVVIGMFFSAVVMYSIIIAAAATLHRSGQADIQNAADAARALAPLAGRSASLLFTVGIVGVGFLAIPVMTTGAAYDLCQSFGLRNGLAYRFRDAKAFYGTIAGVMIAATAMNFIGINPMKALLFAGIVQGISTPPLMLLIVLMTSSRRVMGDKDNLFLARLLGWGTTSLLFAASGALIWSWITR
jgi:NRAMP (natural resistance-associated macrophage protein)-like metal ion transporter